jgi:hypothetical protein
MFRIMLTVIAGSLFYGLSASLCFAGLFSHTRPPSACTAFCLTYNPTAGYVMLVTGMTLFIVFLLSLFRTTKAPI